MAFIIRNRKGRAKTGRTAGHENSVFKTGHPRPLCPAFLPFLRQLLNQFNAINTHLPFLFVTNIIP